MSRWWQRWRSNRGIDDALWDRLLQTYPFARNVGDGRLPRLRSLCDQFLQDKRFSGEGGLTVDDRMGAGIALQACLPVVEIGLHWYDDFEQIIVYPDQFLVPRRQIDEAGVVHEETAWLAGETMDGGPVVLSWADIAPHDQASVSNVVIHEFVHKIDLRDGVADGVPPLPAAQREDWEHGLHDAYQQFVHQLERLERSIPRSVDPESAAADRWYARLDLDPYAAEDPAEFFAVAGEAFFVSPERLARAFPHLFAQMSRFFGLEPTTPAPAHPA